MWLRIKTEQRSPGSKFTTWQWALKFLKPISSDIKRELITNLQILWLNDIIKVSNHILTICKMLAKWSDQNSNHYIQLYIYPFSYGRIWRLKMVIPFHCPRMKNRKKSTCRMELNIYNVPRWEQQSPGFHYIGPRSHNSLHPSASAPPFANPVILDK